MFKEILTRIRQHSQCHPLEKSIVRKLPGRPPPLEVSNILTALRDRLAHRPVIVSFAAALPLAFLESALPEGIPAMRVNPNSPSLVGVGFNPVIYGTNLTGEARSLADSFLSVLGTSIEVSDDQMNLYTALTAVGPTYFLPVFDAIVSVGLEGGLSRLPATCSNVKSPMITGPANAPAARLLKSMVIA